MLSTVKLLVTIEVVMDQVVDLGHQGPGHTHEAVDLARLVHHSVEALLYTELRCFCPVSSCTHACNLINCYSLFSSP